jgi:hypothetical protein
MAVVACSQEHGFVAASDPMPYGNLPVGTACACCPTMPASRRRPTTATTSSTASLDGGKSVVEIYDRINGW